LPLLNASSELKSSSLKKRWTCLRAVRVRVQVRVRLRARARAMARL